MSKTNSRTKQHLQEAAAAEQQQQQWQSSNDSGSSITEQARPRPCLAQQSSQERTVGRDEVKSNGVPDGVALYWVNLIPTKVKLWFESHRVLTPFVPTTVVTTRKGMTMPSRVSNETCCRGSLSRTYMHACSFITYSFFFLGSYMRKHKTPSQHNQSSTRLVARSASAMLYKFDFRRHRLYLLHRTTLAAA